MEHNPFLCDDCVAGRRCPAAATARRAEAQRAYENGFFYVKIRSPRHGLVDVEAWAVDRAAAIAEVSERYPDEEIVEVTDRAHHTDYCNNPKYAAEHAGWLR